MVLAVTVSSLAACSAAGALGGDLPGGENTSGGASATPAPAVTISPSITEHVEQVTVEIEPEAGPVDPSELTIRYTLDGSDPTETGGTGHDYSEPFVLGADGADRDVTVRARVFGSALDPGPVAETTFSIRDGIVVTSNADSGPGSLRQAVADVADGGAIGFADHFTITLLGALEGISIDKNVTILAGDKYIVLTKGSNYRRHFTIAAGNTLTVDGLRLRDGWVSPSDSGGSILVGTGSTLVAKNVTFLYNRAGYGGAIRANGNATVTIMDSTFTDQFASGDGAAIHAPDATVLIERTTFSGGETWGQAAAIWMSSPGGGSLTVEDSHFADNQGGTNPGVVAGAGDGGAILTWNLPLTIRRSTFENNSAGGFGGTVRHNGSWMVIEDSNFTGGHAGRNNGSDVFNGNGGALHITGSGTDTRIQDTLFQANLADQWGGAINVGPGVELHVYRSRFVENRALTIQGDNNYGGGAVNIAPSATAKISRSEFLRNRAYTWSSPQTLSEHARPGGAILNSGDLFISSTTFHGNVAHRGASAIHAMTAAGYTIVTSSAFAGNADPAPTGQSLGAFWSDGTQTSVTNSTFAHNVAGDRGLNATFARPIDGVTMNQFKNSLARTLDENDTPISGIVGVDRVDVVYEYSTGPGGFGDTLAGNNNANRDPAFVRLPDPGADGEWGTSDDDYGDLRLHSGSPDIGAANASILTVDVEDADQDGDTSEKSPFDAAGQPRRQGALDRGAYEE
jgi:predicted outer membrane repeat protein